MKEQTDKPQLFYEIELKAALTKQDYDRLDQLLNNDQRFKKFHTETIKTTRYQPGDVRLRISDKTCEIVCKKGLVTKICRKEVKIPIDSEEKLDYFDKVLEILEFKPDRSWLKHKQEFTYEMNGFEYVVCLQHIEDFAYILEVEFIADRDQSHLHSDNLHKILEELNVKLIDNERFLNRVEDFRAGKTTIDYQP